MDLSQLICRDMRTMRNGVVHAYFGVDLDVPWDTVMTDVPGLIEALDRAVGPKPI